MYVCHESQTEGGADQNPVNSTTVCVLLHSPPPSVMTRIPSRSPISPSSHMSNDQGCWGSAARRRGNTTFPARTGICRTKPVRVWMYSVMNIQWQWIYSVNDVQCVSMDVQCHEWLLGGKCLIQNDSAMWARMCNLAVKRHTHTLNRTHTYMHTHTYILERAHSRAVWAAVKFKVLKCRHQDLEWHKALFKLRTRE